MKVKSNNGGYCPFCGKNNLEIEEGNNEYK